MKIPPTGPGLIRAVRAQAVEVIRDCERWNESHPHDTPFDAGPERVLVSLCDRGLRAAAAGDGAEYARVARLLVEQAERALA